MQLDCSQSENCIMSRNSAVHVMKVAANSSFVSFTRTIFGIFFDVVFVYFTDWILFSTSRSK